MFDTVEVLKIFGEVVIARKHSLVLDGDATPKRATYHLFDRRDKKLGTIQFFSKYVKVLKGKDTQIFKDKITNKADIVDLADKVLLYLSGDKVSEILSMYENVCGDSNKQPKMDGGTNFCKCPKCGSRIPHKQGTPCDQIKCTKCGTTMEGERS